MNLVTVDGCVNIVDGQHAFQAVATPSPIACGLACWMQTASPHHLYITAALEWLPTSCPPCLPATLQERSAIESDFAAGRVRVVVATVAFGMGEQFGRVHSWLQFA